MAAFVLDSSVAAAWCFPGEATDHTNAVLLALSGGSEARVPRLWAYEIRNCVLMGMRRKRITERQAAEFLDSLASLPLFYVDPPSYDAIFELSCLYGLTFYDAAYLDLAIREKLPLSSLDNALIQAALRAGVPIYSNSSRPHVSGSEQ
jgi:predicted nucleic acid-binding protein